MIVAKDSIKDFIKNQATLEDLAERLGVSRQTVYNIQIGLNISSEMIEKLMKETGFSFDKSFEICDE